METLGLTSIVSCIIVSIIAAVHSETLELRISEQVVSGGANVRVECVVRDYEAGMLVYWWKRQGDVEVQIGTNKKMKENFFGATASGSVSSQGTEVTFILDMAGVTSIDSGEYGCSNPDVEGSGVYWELTVTTPVQEMRLYAMRSADANEDPLKEYADGEEIPFQQDDEYYFRCAATGGYPPAQMALTLEYDSFKENLNDKFFRESVAYLDVEEGSRGMHSYTSKATMTSTESVRATRAVTSMVFRCVASVPGQKEVSVHIRPVMKFPPSLECQHSHQTSVMWEAQVELSCVVSADPPADSLLWYWNANGQNVTVHPNQSEGHYRFVIEDGPKPDTKVAKLVIERTFSQSFREYSLIVSNGIGSVSHTVDLELDQALEIHSGAECRTWSSISLIFMPVLVWFH